MRLGALCRETTTESPYVREGFELRADPAPHPTLIDSWFDDLSRVVSTRTLPAMRLSLPPNSYPPTSEDVSSAVSHLRAELEATTDPSLRALLHYELGLLFEQLRDDNSAAKELLLAVNAQSALHEPLEHLIALIERRRSHVNLGKLLERLGRVAETPAEIVRAQVARGDFLTDHRTNLAQAAEAYEQVARMQPDYRLAWLSLHYLGARQSDAKLVESALNARIGQASHKGYRDALRLQLARFQALRGRHDLARATLEAAATPHSPVVYPALLQLEQLIRIEDHSTRAKVLEQQGELLALGIADAAYAFAHGIPSAHRERTLLADVSLRTALNLTLSGSPRSRIAQALSRASDAGADPLLIERIAHEAVGSGVETSDIGGLDEGLSSLPSADELSAARLVRKAVSLRTNLDDEAVALLGKAVSEDPNGLTARALQLEALWALRDFRTLGKVYEDIASHVTTESARTRCLLLAATCWSFSNEPSERARAALNGLAGSPENASAVAELSGVLAAVRGDELWRSEALTRVLEGPASGGQTAALLELTLRAIQRRDLSEARLRVQTLLQSSAAQPLAHLLTAFIPALTQGVAHGERARIAALEGLAPHAETGTSIALTQWAAHLRSQLGDGNVARSLLLELHAQHPTDVAVVLQLAPTLVGLNDPAAAVQALSETAAAISDPRAQRTLYFYAGVTAWTAKLRETAIGCFEAALGANGASPAASQLLQWALRAASPDDTSARRKLLTTGDSTSTDEDRGLLALERFALEVGFGNLKTAATEALDEADELSLDEVSEAIGLARALWPDAKHHLEALRHLQSQSPMAKELAACSAYYEARSAGNASADRLLALAESWSEQGSLAAALEWFGVAVNAGNPGAEVKARRALAAHLPSEARAALSASASLVEHLCDLGVSNVEATSDAERLVTAEHQGPTTNPAQRGRALNALVGHWDAEHPEQALTVRLLSAYNFLADEDFTEAARLFREVVGVDPTELSAWEGLADCAREQLNHEELASALTRVGELQSDAKRAAAALREAAQCHLDVLDTPELGWRCLEQAVALDIAHGRAFERLFRHLRKQDEHQRVISLATRRLTVVEAAKDIARLHWDRARAHRSLGHFDEALSDLENVRLLEPDHVGARALASEIYISTGTYERAASELTELAKLPNAPAEQRRLSAITAIDLYDTKLGNLDGALEAFQLVRDVPGNLQPLLEHLVSACARQRRWQDAVRLLDDLQTHGSTGKARSDAARLHMAILRDELGQPEQAVNSVRTLLSELPGDPEAVDLVLEGVFTENETSELLTENLEGILARAASDLDAEAAARLAQVAEELDHLDLRLLSLSSLVLAGSPSRQVLDELDQLLERCAPYPQMVVPPETLDALTSPEDSGPLLEILKVVSPYLPELLGPSLRSLGLGRKERKAAADAIGVRSEVSAWTGALSLGEVELYLANRGGYEVTGIADEKQPSIVIASEARALDVRDRGLIAAWLFGLSRGTSVCLQRSPTEVAALLVAACRVGGAAPNVPPFALTPEFERLLARELPRRARRSLEGLAGEVIKQEQDPLLFAQGARDTLNRIAAVASGDFSHVILTESERITSTRNLDSHRQGQLAALLRFCLSPTYLQIREQLGLNAR